MYKVLIIGTGVFGVAMGQVMAQNGHQVAYLTNHKEICGDLLKGKFQAYAGVDLIPPVAVFTTPKLALTHRYDFIVIAVPSGAIRTMWETVSPHLQHPVTILNLAKGINEDGPWSTYFQANPLVKTYCALSGPSFAKEVVKQNRTLVNVFTATEDDFQRCVHLLNNHYFRVQRLHSTVETVATKIGAIKNVIAIGLGMVNQMTESKNTAAAILTMAFQDLRILLQNQHPGEEIDLQQPYALGDILLTASSPLSRNYRFGQLASRIGFQQAIQENLDTVEGLTMLRLMSEHWALETLPLKFFNPLIAVFRGQIQARDFLDVVWSHL